MIKKQKLIRDFGVQKQNNKRKEKKKKNKDPSVDRLRKLHDGLYCCLPKLFDVCGGHVNVA